tara:strand:+ start:6488 stop:6676 length:189 start_codon:yes stop_codon:yes gene_type:complete
MAEKNKAKKETQVISNADRLENLMKQREEVKMMLLKLQGAIELLQSMEGSEEEAQADVNKSE